MKGNLSTALLWTGGVLLGHAVFINDIPVYLDRNNPKAAEEIEKAIPSIKDFLSALDPEVPVLFKAPGEQDSTRPLSDFTRPLGLLFLGSGIALKFAGR